MVRDIQALSKAGDDTESLTPELAIASFNEYERKVYESIKDAIRKECLSELKGRYAIAQQIYKVYMETKSAKSRYGLGFMKRLAIALGYKTANPLHEMVRVVEAWPTWDALENQVITNLNGVSQIRWKDTVLLARLQSDPIQFQAAIDQINDATPVKQLESSFKAEGSNKQGRNPKAPETLSDLFHDITKTIRGMIKRYDLNWEPFDIVTVCKEVYDSEEVTDNEIKAIRTQVQSVLSNLDVAEEVIQDLKAIFVEAGKMLNIEEELVPLKGKKA